MKLRPFWMWAGALFVAAVVSSNVLAGNTVRVGSDVLVVGDTATQVLGLLGTPVVKVPVENKYGAHLGEKWQYARPDGHVLVITLVEGRVADIDDRLSSH
ncbi:MAG: DUF2845 domain-containing protein [Rhodanobacter sp.]